MENRPKLKNAPKAIFRARDSFPDFQLIALIRDPRNNCVSMKFGICATALFYLEKGESLYSERRFPVEGHLGGVSGSEIEHLVWGVKHCKPARGVTTTP